MARAPALVAIGIALATFAGCVDGGDDADDNGPAFADLVFRGGMVWTGDQAGTRAEAIAVANGTIVYVGDNAGVEDWIGPDTKVIDLSNGTLLPGLRDNHAHVIEVSHPEPNLDHARTGSPPAEVYRPTYSEYDPLGAERYRAGVFAYHVRTKAESRSPTDGCAHTAVTDAMKANLLTAQEEAIRQGLVAIVEAGLYDLGQLDALFELQDEGQLKLRFLVRVAWGCLEQAADLGYTQGAGGDWVKILGVKLYSDGWLGPRSAALQEPFADRPGWTGILFLEDERARRDVARARELGYNIAAHAIGDRGVLTMLDAYEAAGVTPEDRWSLEHVSVWPENLRARMLENGVIGSIQLSFPTTDQHFAESALGAERLAWTYPWKTALDEGLHLAGSSDFDIEVLAPLWGLQRAVTRQELDGTPDGGWLAGEALPLETALGLVTSAAAYAALEDTERGTLEVGKAADLVALRDDLFAIAASLIASATVTHTVVNGVLVFEGAVAYPPTPASLAAVRLLPAPSDHAHAEAGTSHIPHL